MRKQKGSPSPYVIRLILSGLFALVSLTPGFAHETAKSKTEHRNKLQSITRGLALGKDTRILPYAILGPVAADQLVGLKLEHRSFWNASDRISHHFRFENLHDYYWRLRYDANSLSTATTRISFTFKRKLDLDSHFYGLGSAIDKSNRAPMTYASVVVYGEISRLLSEGLRLGWSPGFWQFRSGILDTERNHGTDNVTTARYVTSRFSLRDGSREQENETGRATRWATYLEFGLPLNSSVAAYARVNFRTLTSVPVFNKTRFSLGTRVEYLASPARRLVPYFALPEIGSRSGLRGFSKARFRNYAVLALDLEYAVPLSSAIEGFLLTDLAQTAKSPAGLLRKPMHQSYGLGLRVRNASRPASFGVAVGREGWKVFAVVGVGLG